MSTLQERLAQAMAPPCTVTAADLARACKVKAPSVHEWINGPTKTLKGPNAVRVAHELNVNVEWLTTGRGPMRGAGTTGTQRLLEASGPLANEDAESLLLVTRSLATTVLNRLPGTAAVFRDFLSDAATKAGLQIDSGLIASFLGIADEALDAEAAAARALERARAGGRSRPKK